MNDVYVPTKLPPIPRPAPMFIFPPSTVSVDSGDVVPIPTLPLPLIKKADAAEGEDTCNKLALFEPVIIALSIMVGENISIY
jgi:hypothetical protein